MRFYSDVTKSFYENEKDCLKAEKAYSDKLAKENAEKEKLAEERKVMAKKIEDAHAARVAAYKAEVDLIKEFNEKFGGYHMTISNVSDFANDIFENVFRFF